jgi:hypothetical protein
MKSKRMAKLDKIIGYLGKYSLIVPYLINRKSEKGEAEVWVICPYPQPTSLQNLVYYRPLGRLFLQPQSLTSCESITRLMDEDIESLTDGAFLGLMVEIKSAIETARQKLQDDVRKFDKALSLF